MKPVTLLVAFHLPMVAVLEVASSTNLTGIAHAARDQIGKTVSYDPSYQPGDLVTCTVPPNLAHIMVVSDRKNPSGQPLVIHNIGAGVQEEDRLFEFKITGHYRVKVSVSGRRR